MKNMIIKLMSSGMNQTDVAKVAGCSQPAISDILNGKNKNPSLSIGVNIAKECDRRGIDWSIDDFLTE